MPEVFGNTQSVTIKYLTGEYSIVTPTLASVRLDADKNCRN